jgi:hypothetical protein
MNKYISFFVIFVICFIPLHGMQQKQISLKPKKGPLYQFFGSGTDFPYKTNDLYKNPNFTRFATESFVFNQKGTTEAINVKAAQDDTKVSIHVGPHYANKIDLFDSDNITVARGPHHGKATAALAYSPSKKRLDQEGLLILGSPNLSNNTWKNDLDLGKDDLHNNIETIIATNDVELVENAYQAINSSSPIKPLKKKNYIKESPKKPIFATSKHTDLNKSLAQRLLNLADDPHNNRCAYVRTMNINDKEITKAAITAKKSGAQVEFIVNYTALSSQGLPLLQKLDAANIPVNVFTPTNGYRVCHHSKTMDIVKGTAFSHVENTGNLTDECATQTNYSVFLPNNKEVTQASIADFNKVKQVCDLLAPALQLKEKSDLKKREQKAAKRKAAQEEKVASSKKQKTK